MSILIFSVVIGLLKILSDQPAVSYADIMVMHSVISPHVDKQRIQPISYSPPLRGVVGVVPAPALASCYNAQRYSETPSHSDLPSDGPTCTPASFRNSSVSNSGELLLIFPLTEEGTREERACVAITSPQAYCDIPLDSPLSAFPLV
jgi:hypothetical protein